MSKKVKEITADEWMAANFKTINREPPKNSFCLNDLIRKTGYSYHTARRLLNEMTNAGKLKKEQYVVNKKLTSYYTPIK